MHTYSVFLGGDNAEYKAGKLPFWGNLRIVSECSFAIILEACVAPTSHVGALPFIKAREVFCFYKSFLFGSFIQALRFKK